MNTNVGIVAATLSQPLNNSIEVSAIADYSQGDIAGFAADFPDTYSRISNHTIQHESRVFQNVSISQFLYLTE